MGADVLRGRTGTEGLRGLAVRSGSATAPRTSRGRGGTSIRLGAVAGGMIVGRIQCATDFWPRASARGARKERG
jgi:hypothetical protein